jgi:hypothetical protein
MGSLVTSGAGELIPVTGTEATLAVGMAGDDAEPFALMAEMAVFDESVMTGDWPDMSEDIGNAGRTGSGWGCGSGWAVTQFGLESEESFWSLAFLAATTLGLSPETLSDFSSSTSAVDEAPILDGVVTWTVCAAWF